MFIIIKFRKYRIREKKKVTIPHDPTATIDVGDNPFSLSSSVIYIRSSLSDSLCTRVCVYLDIYIYIYIYTYTHIYKIFLIK